MKKEVVEILIDAESTFRCVDASDQKSTPAEKAELALRYYFASFEGMLDSQEGYHDQLQQVQR